MALWGCMQRTSLQGVMQCLSLSAFAFQIMQTETGEVLKCDPHTRHVLNVGNWQLMLGPHASVRKYLCRTVLSPGIQAL